MKLIPLASKYALFVVYIGYLMLIRMTSIAYANIPAAYLACEGAMEKAPCSLPGPQFGVCVRDTLCSDPSETSVNECMICVDECWASVDGAGCIRPWTGEEGVCESQDRCTDKPETSFEECRRCVEGQPWIESTNDETQAGCQQGYNSQSITDKKIWWLHFVICLMFLAYRIVLRAQGFIFFEYNEQKK